VVATDYLPPKPLLVRGHKLLAPAKPKTLLCKLWGDNWRTPVKDGGTDSPCNNNPAGCELKEKE